jgi:hypothetical protein
VPAPVVDQRAEHIVVKQPLVQLVRRIRKSESGDKDEWCGRQQRDDDADAAEGETDKPDHDQANAPCWSHRNLYIRFIVCVSNSSAETAVKTTTAPRIITILAAGMLCANRNCTSS